MSTRRVPRGAPPTAASGAGRSHPSRARQPLIPEPSRSLPAVFLRANVRHPLVYRKRVRTADPGARPGDLVAVYADVEQQDGTSQTMLVGYGLYNPRSEIAVRMVRYGEALPDEAYWNEMLRQAVRLRRDQLRLDEVTDAYRVVHAESDGLPGLMIDRFGDVLSAEAFSWGMFQRAEEILQRLHVELGTRHHTIRTGPHVLSQEGFESPIVMSAEAPRSVTVQEYGTRFRIRLDEESHKTGFFCDQRDNRRMLASFCRDRSVLDLCCYSGGFAIQAKRLGDAAEVIGVDLDEHPLKTAKENANLNQVRVKFVQADVFPYMRDMQRNGQQFDVVVLDPPKLIRSRAELDEGTRKHFDLNRLAMQLVKPGGLLLSCTCAGLLSQAEFSRLLMSAARQAGPPIDPHNEHSWRKPRQMRIIARTGAAADHPIAGNCPETEYLNAVWMIMDDYS
ncbi:MAG: class I SAM-dependent rRNA methyltransferase [Pirellulaceae bacterium]|nr:class I SAM-dependent rRNA methyltransferase [Planctomycetales bacterium]